MAPISGLDLAPSNYSPAEDVSSAGEKVVSTGRIMDVLLDGASFWWIKSDQSNDVREVSIRGRTFSGDYRGETLKLNGTSFVVTRQEYIRLLEITLATTATAANVTVGRAFRTGIVTDTLLTIPFNQIGKTTALKQSYPVEYESRVRYEKLFFYNNTGFVVTNIAIKIEEADSIAGSVVCGAETSVNSELVIENRTIAPTGVTFVDAGVQTLGPASMNLQDAAALWLKQTLLQEGWVSRDNALLTITVDATVNAVPAQGTYQILVEPAVAVFEREWPFNVEG